MARMHEKKEKKELKKKKNEKKKRRERGKKIYHRIKSSVFIFSINLEEKLQLSANICPSVTAHTHTSERFPSDELLLFSFVSLHSVL